MSTDDEQKYLILYSIGNVKYCCSFIFHLIVGLQDSYCLFHIACIGAYIALFWNGLL
jgi:hypothetical protein